MEPVKPPADHHRADRGRGAEIKFYEALIDSDLAGQVYYDVHVGRQVDLFAWVMNRGRCAIEVKGGRHWINDGKWFCREKDGNELALTNSPPEDAMSRALAIRDAMGQRLDGHKPWITVLLALPDMAKEDAAIAEFADDHHVRVLWGLNDLAGQLQRIVSEEGDYAQFDELDVRAELAALNRQPVPLEWSERRARLKAAEEGGPASQQKPGHSEAEMAAAAATGHVFNIHNYGTLIVCSSVAEMRAAMGHAGMGASGRDDVAPPITADPFAIDDVDDAVASAPEAARYGEASDEDPFDDRDPFS